MKWSLKQQHTNDPKCRWLWAIYDDDGEMLEWGFSRWHWRAVRKIHVRCNRRYDLGAR